MIGPVGDDHGVVSGDQPAHLAGVRRGGHLVLEQIKRLGAQPQIGLRWPQELAAPQPGDLLALGREQGGQRPDQGEVVTNEGELPLDGGHAAQGERGVGLIGDVHGSFAPALGDLNQATPSMEAVAISRTV